MVSLSCSRSRSLLLHDVQLVIEEDKKFLKLLEILGHYQEKGSVIIFVDKQEHADALLKDLMKASYPCMSLHGGQPAVSSLCSLSGPLPPGVVGGPCLHGLSGAGPVL